MSFYFAIRMTCLHHIYLFWISILGKIKYQQPCFVSLFVFLDVTPGEFFRIIISSYAYTYVNNYKILHVFICNVCFNKNKHSHDKEEMWSWRKRTWNRIGAHGEKNPLTFTVEEWNYSCLLYNKNISGRSI